ncbi:MAG: Hpt domain-containing protein [Treponema sp.]|nr:Hpt domain-containing protein [Treponema sp.]
MNLALLYSQLIRVEGLDIWEGLAHVGCSREVYADALRLFCGDLEKRNAVFKEFQDQESWEEYAACAHAVKGGLAGIGAWELAEKARELENAARKGDYEFCRESSAGALEEIKKLIASLKSSVLFSKEAVKREKVSRDYLEKKLSKLYLACSSGDSAEADALIRELKTKTCGEENDAIVDMICTNVENLDYHLALQILAEQPYIKKTL